MTSLKSIFIVLAALSLLVMLAMLFPDAGLMRRPYIFILWALHALSGLVLIILTYQNKVTGKVKAFLLLAGFSALGFILGVVLHNLFYALGILTGEIAILNAILGFLGGGFFLLATILFPIGLIVGIVGTFVLWKQILAGKGSD